MKNLMIDLETMGSKGCSVIMQIGACFFEPETGEIGRTFLTNVDLDSCLRAGLRITADTLYWWLQQSDAARLSINKSNESIPFVSLSTALGTLSLFNSTEANDGQVGAKNVWGHSAFDFRLLQDAYYAINMPFPFHYRASRDLRSLFDDNNFDPYVHKTPEGSVAHTALSDCIHQVNLMHLCLEQKKENTKQARENTI